MRNIITLRTIIGLVFLAAAVSACEESIAPDDVPYVERIVVRGVLTNGRPVDSIRFTRTLPLNVAYDPQVAELRDVRGSIEESGTIHPLVHIGNGYYKAEGLIPKSGRIYTLRAEWNGKIVTASTTIPYPAQVDSVIITKQRVEYDYEYVESDTVYTITVMVAPREPEIYGMGAYSVSDAGGNRTTSDYLHYISRWKDTVSNGRLQQPLAFFASSSYTPPFTGSTTINSYDEPFYNYYKSSDFDDFEGPFSNGEETTRWNIRGDGLGMFIGRAISTHNFFLSI